MTSDGRIISPDVLQILETLIEFVNLADPPALPTAPPPTKPTFEQLRRESHKDQESYKLESKDNMKNFLPKLRLNLTLHAQVAMGPFDASQVDFNCMWRLTNTDFSFDVLNPFGSK
ncbi:hypothetical protein GOBAR_AA37794 [Gossypium barbadense]|uniref:Uncharacterized protein n=1 Tax=Gossypium barbadense TaxID=3634 RepID=A0A2P5VVP7_GOSBA|nr:hypothetical protein GOBAR_AA37794 [Gossypium barbadense]